MERTYKDRLSGHVIACAEHARAHMTLASDFEERFEEIEAEIRADERARMESDADLRDSPKENEK